ncbi:hypothetical protein Acsp02_51500 [Actinoplanes sp. NBRC 103695]|nr:hypothetical protein Acsp02_51500 [Actinoplanes sp. NBRC 103695]
MVAQRGIRAEIPLWPTTACLVYHSRPLLPPTAPGHQPRPATAATGRSNGEQAPGRLASRPDPAPGASNGNQGEQAPAQPGTPRKQRQPRQADPGPTPHPAQATATKASRPRPDPAPGASNGSQGDQAPGHLAHPAARPDQTSTSKGV